MSRRDWDDDPDEDWSDDDEDDGDSETVPCPSCGAEVYEDAERCPSCESYLVHSTRAWTGKPAWWILLGLAGIGAVLWSLLR